MPTKDCPFFDTCAAPLCPLDSQSLSAGIWYVDEPICKNKDFASLRWIENQIKLARRRTKDTTIYYTVKLLSRNLKNLKGIDPEKEVR